MIVYEQDPDVVRWGLHNLIDVCTLSNSGSCNSVTCYGMDTFNVEYVREYYNDPLYASNVENDAVIAHALQEELSRIANVEASGLNNSEQESIITQHWPGPHETYHDSEHEDDQTVAVAYSECKMDADYCSKNVADYSSKDEISIPISSSSNGENSLNMEELDVILNIASESALDGEVGKRINEMVPVPHVPKTNGEIPSEDEQMSDHQRLLERLKVYYLVENKVQGDGNCQFSSLSDQLYHSPEHHKLVREQVIDQLKSQPQLYNGYVSMAYGDYLKKMSKSGEWGDHVTLQAAADSYGIKIFMITSFRDTCYIEILPNVQKSNRVIFLSFWAEVHYNSIYPEGGKHLDLICQSNENCSMIFLIRVYLYFGFHIMLSWSSIKANLKNMSMGEVLLGVNKCPFANFTSLFLCHPILCHVCLICFGWNLLCSFVLSFQVVGGPNMHARYLFLNSNRFSMAAISFSLI
ncbi:hypothetical protein OIU76_013073 [Salix suchowensis]|nr:hypothetical protein OIU76_013073 [Salix suchowensis]